LKLNIEKGKDILLKVGQVAEQIGEQVYAVGGFVRDLYLGKEGTDIDFVVIDDALKFTQTFKKKYNAGKIVSFPRFGTARLMYRNYKLEFVTARSEHYESDSRKPTVAKADLKSDLSRRDFTINTLAMAISPGHLGEVIDIYGGIEDINCKMIKTPLDPVITFKDDPLRIMRAIRFAGKLNFKLDRLAYEAIIETRGRLNIISQERITEEFNKILLTDKPSYGLKLMRELRLLDIIFPELSDLTGVDQRQDYHHKDVFEHTLQVVDNIAVHSEKLELRLAALLHDIAKPQTKRFIEGAGWTFHGHEDLGARMVEEIGRRMKYPNSIIHYVKKLVRLHLRPMQLVDESVTDSAVRRLMVQAGEEIDDLMQLCRADITSKNPKKVQRFLTNFDIVEEKMKQVEEKDKLRNFRIAIDGHQIMKELNIPPGPVVGEIKQAITDAVLDGKIPNEYEACLKYLKKIKE
jgi:putative nucleotidyltransferase with HDIG domain